MLNIPGAIKNLYKSDSVRKNFRIHFPGGEYRDITNDDIELESVYLTESISSMSVIKFGLCESPCLEFVCHHAQSFKGCAIEASLEIDISSLSEGELVSKELKGVIRRDDTPYYNVLSDGSYRVESAGNVDFDVRVVTYNGEDWHTVLIPCDYDSTSDISYAEFWCDINTSLTIEYNPDADIEDFKIYYVHSITPETAEDVPYPFFSIPYGCFITKKCVKDGDSDRRIVTAYNKVAYQDWKMCTEFQRNKFNLYTGHNVNYDFDVLKMFAELYQTTDILPESIRTQDTSLIRSSSISSWTIGGSIVERASNYIRTETKLKIKTYYIVKRHVWHDGVEYHYDNPNSVFKFYVKNAALLGYKTIPETIMQDIYGVLEDSSYKPEKVEKIVRNRLTPYIYMYYDWFAFNSSDEIIDSLNSDAGNYTYSHFDYGEDIVYYPYITDLTHTKISGTRTWETTPWMAVYVPYAVDVTVEKTTESRHFHMGRWITSTSTVELLAKNYQFYYPDSIHLYRYDDEEAGTDRTMSIPRKKVIIRSQTNKKINGYTAGYYLDDLLEKTSFKEIFTSWVEIQGKFVVASRESGKLKIISLTDHLSLYPDETIYPDNTLYPRDIDEMVSRCQYTRCQYDERPTKHYDRISCTWTDSDNNEHYQFYQIVPTDSDGYDPDDYHFQSFLKNSRAGAII